MEIRLGNQGKKLTLDRLPVFLCLGSEKCYRFRRLEPAWTAAARPAMGPGKREPGIDAAQHDPLGMRMPPRPANRPIMHPAAGKPADNAIARAIRAGRDGQLFDKKNKHMDFRPDGAAPGTGRRILTRRGVPDRRRPGQNDRPSHSVGPQQLGIRYHFSMARGRSDIRPLQDMCILHNNYAFTGNRWRSRRWPPFYVRGLRLPLPQPKCVKSAPHFQIPARHKQEILRTT